MLFLAGKLKAFLHQRIAHIQMEIQIEYRFHGQVFPLTLQKKVRPVYEHCFAALAKYFVHPNR